MLTYLILTFNRQDYARRQLLCLSNSEAKAIVMDGSRTNWGSGDCGSINKLHWNYHHMPGEFNYLERLKVGLRFVTTEFVCLLDDQDMYFPSVHSKAIEMQKRSEYSYSCIAPKPGLTFKLEDTVGFAPWGHWSDEVNFEEEIGCERASRILYTRRTANFYYAPIRTKYLMEFIKALHNVIGKEAEYVWGFIECAMTLFLASKGRLGIMGDIGWLRTEEVHEKKSRTSNFMPTVASKKDVEFLLSLVPNHLPSCAYPNVQNSECSLFHILETWIGKSEWEYSTTVGERNSSSGNKPKRSQELYLRAINKLVWKFAPWLRFSVAQHRSVRARKSSGEANVFTTADFCRYFNCERIPEEAHAIMGIHTLFPRGITREVFLNYSR